MENLSSSSKLEPLMTWHHWPLSGLNTHVISRKYLGDDFDVGMVEISQL